MSMGKLFQAQAPRYEKDLFIKLVLGLPNTNLHMLLRIS
jgi:hypothetical protein